MPEGNLEGKKQNGTHSFTFQSSKSKEKILLKNQIRSTINGTKINIFLKHQTWSVTDPWWGIKPNSEENMGGNNETIRSESK